MTSMALAPQARPELPLPIDPALDQRLHWFVSRLSGIDANGIAGHVEVEAEAAPPEDVREALQARLRAIDRWLAPIGEDAVLPLVHRLFSGLESAKGDVDRLTARLASYPAVLADMPAFALQGAIDAFVAGREGNRVFVPTAAQIRASAVLLADPMRRERRSIALVLTARIKPPPSPQGRRAELAAAARRAFRIPEPDQQAGSRPSPPPSPGELGNLARDIFLGVGFSPPFPRSSPSTAPKSADPEVLAPSLLDEAIRTGTADPRPMPKLSARHRMALGLPPLKPPEEEMPADRFRDEDAA